MTRVRNQIEEPVVTQYEILLNGSPIASGPQTAYAADKEMTDEVNSGFHQRVAAGEVFNNPCVLTVHKRYHSVQEAKWQTVFAADTSVKYSWGGGNWTHYNLLNEVSFYGWDHCHLAPDLSETGAADAKQKCLANVDSTPYEFFEDLAELGETIRFLRNPAKAIERLCLSFERKKNKINRIRDIKRRAKALADLWNQYRFAFAPLLRSLMTAAEAFLNFESLERPARRTSHGFGSNATEGSDIFEPWTVIGPAERCIFTYLKTDSRSIDYHASIYYEVSNPLVDWKFALGLRLKDIPSTAWEIIPLSFMVDRILDIKKMIQGLVNIADPQVTFLASSLTSKRRDLVQLTTLDRRYDYGSYIHTQNDIDFFFVEEFEYRRDEWVPSAADTLPRFTPKKFVNSVEKILDLLAISASRLL